MKAKYLFDVVEEASKRGLSGILMSLSYGQPFGVRYQGRRIDSTYLLSIIKDLMNDDNDGDVCIRFDSAEDGVVRDIAIEICNDSHRYGICIEDVCLDGAGMLIRVRETSGE